MSTGTVRIGIDATSWTNDRGFGRFTREIVTALAARESEFRYELLFDRPPDTPVPDGVEVVAAETRRNLNQSTAGDTSRSLAYLWKMGRLVRSRRFDLFFFPTVYSFFPIPSKVPCVVCYHDTTAERFPELLFPTRRNKLLWNLKTALAKLQTTRAMTVSNSSADDLADLLRIPRDRIDVVTEGADPVFRVLEDAPTGERERHGIPAEGVLLIHVGGMNAHKNILGLLQAMPEVLAAEPDVHLAIVGDTSGRGFWDNVPELMEFVGSRPELERRVHFTGYIPDEELVALLNETDALVFPSFWEGFGLPAVEAMACGVPVLASERASLPEVVGDAGLYFDPRSPSAIADCILTFIRDRELRSRLPEKALRRAGGFSWDRAAGLAEESFRRCIGRSAVLPDLAEA